MSKAQNTSDKKKKVHFNIIDILVIIVLIAAVFVGVKVLTLKPASQPEVETRIATAVVEIRDVEKHFIEQIEVGQKAYLTVDNVDEVTIIDSTGPLPNDILGFDLETGAYTYSSSENSRYKVQLTIQAEVKEDDANIYAGSTSLKVGKGLYIKGKGYSARGFVVELDTKAKGE